MKIFKTPKLWNSALKLIPGGNGLLSKRPNRYLPGYWPTYFKIAKGIKLKTLNNKSYIDMSNMGVGASILGYSNNYVNKKVKQAIDMGIASTLNCKEEYDLATEEIDLVVNLKRQNVDYMHRQIIKRRKDV